MKLSDRLGSALLVASLVGAAWTLPASAGPPAMPYFDWAGPYVGAQGGYGWGQSTAGTTSFFSDPAGTSLAAQIPGFSFDPGGAIGGAEAGYNWHIGNMIAGLVADISATDIAGSYTSPTYGFTVDSKINFLSTLRAQVGLPFDRLLLFATGGLAVGGVDTTLHDTYPATTFNTSSSTTRVGWALGGGVSYAANSNVILKAEYLYTDLGSATDSFPEDPTGAIGWPLIQTPSSVTASILRFAIDFKY